MIRGLVTIVCFAVRPIHDASADMNDEDGTSLPY